MDDDTRAEIFARLAENTPEPTTELDFRNPFELLVAVILSAQATDQSVNKATAALFEVAPTPADMLELGEECLRGYIQTVGLYNSKARNIIGACRKLLDEHNGAVPRDRDALQALPGVGRKTANVILNTAFDEATVAVDTHIFRVANRTGLAPGKDVREVEAELTRLTPSTYLKNAHHWLILHGRYVCTARKPRCGACVIYDLCEYPERAYYAQA